MNDDVVRRCSGVGGDGGGGGRFGVVDGAEEAAAGEHLEVGRGQAVDEEVRGSVDLKRLRS